MKGHKLYAAETNNGLVAFTQAEIELINTATYNIIDHYLTASDETRSIGAGWYTGEAGALALRIADETGISFETAAAVVAVCSPCTRWSIQAENTIPFVQHMLNGSSIHTAPKCSLYLTSMEKAALILLYDDMSVLHGPKVEPFYQNIIGNSSVVTLDVWAIRAALVRHTDEDETKRWGKGRRRMVLEAAYHAAARTLGQTVAATQAVVWIIVRGAVD